MLYTNSTASPAARLRAHCGPAPAPAGGYSTGPPGQAKTGGALQTGNRPLARPAPPAGLRPKAGPPLPRAGVPAGSSPPSPPPQPRAEKGPLTVPPPPQDPHGSDVVQPSTDPHSPPRPL